MLKLKVPAIQPQPSKVDEDAEADAFFGRHQGGTGNVWIVTAYSDGDKTRSGVFSSVDKAEEWLKSIHDEYDSSVLVPFIVDEPDYGNVVPN